MNTKVSRMCRVHAAFPVRRETAGKNPIVNKVSLVFRKTTARLYSYYSYNRNKNLLISKLVGIKLWFFFI